MINLIIESCNATIFRKKDKSTTKLRGGARREQGGIFESRSAESNVVYTRTKLSFMYIQYMLNPFASSCNYYFIS